MIVHFAGPSFGIKTKIVFYRTIINTIHKLDHTLSHDWVEPAYSRSLRGTDLEVDWVEVCGVVERAIEQSDVVIIDASENSYLGVGYQIAYALQMKKPTLLLLKNGVETSIFGKGVRNDLLKHYEYKNSKDAQIAVTNFINDYNIASKDLRFNFVLDRNIYNYLRWLSFESGKTKSEILRDLVLSDMDDR